MSKDNPIKHKRKKSADELIKYPRHQTNASSTVVGRRAKGLKTLCDFASPRATETTLPEGSLQGKG